MKSQSDRVTPSLYFLWKQHSEVKHYVKMGDKLRKNNRCHGFGSPLVSRTASMPLLDINLIKDIPSFGVFMMVVKGIDKLFPGSKGMVSYSRSTVQKTQQIIK